MVDSDDLLTALGRVVREREETARDGAPPVPQAAVSNQHLVDAVMAGLAQGNPVTESASSPDAERQPVPLRPGTQDARGGETRRVRRALWLGLPALAAAAGLSLLLGRGVLSRDSDSALAPYTAELRGGISAVRSAKSTGANMLTLAPGTQLTVLLRPDEPVIGQVSGLAALASNSANASFRVIETRNSASPSGSLRLTFAVPADLPLQGNLCAVVGRVDRLQVGLLDVAGKGEGWQRFCWQFAHLDAKTNP